MAGMAERHLDRGRRTRQRLVDAARVVFERDGFLNSRLVDITDEAGTAIGSFYTYFDSKEAVLEAVFDDVRDEMWHARPARPAADGCRLPPAAADRPARRIPATSRHRPPNGGA